MRLIHKNGSLFDAPQGVILAHACNGMGVWGRGIAVEFKNRFPNSYEEYHNFCVLEKHEDQNPTGQTLICNEENNYKVACLITSLGYGVATDPKGAILNRTERALEDLFQQATTFGIKNIHSNKFNSGLFGVPWNETESILKDALKRYPEITWTVWTPNET